MTAGYQRKTAFCSRHWLMQLCLIHQAELVPTVVAAVHRAKEPWEGSDGAVYMVRELAAVAPTEACAFIPQLADLARLATFQHAFNMHETIWRSLPSIATSIGMKVFKGQFLEMFLPPLFADLKCGHQLAEAEAGACISKLRDLIGPRIFAGRLDAAQAMVMETNPNILPQQHGVGGLGAVTASSGMHSATGLPVVSAAVTGDRAQSMR